MFKMAFQVVELTIDADNNVTDRKVIPYPYTTHREAVLAIESVVPTFSSYGHDENGNFFSMLSGQVTSSTSSNAPTN